MPAIKLPRTNGRPLAFEGRLIAKLSSKALKGHLSLRWNEIALYAANGKYVVAISYRTRVEDETPEHVVAVCKDAEAVAQQLRTYGPGVHFGAELRDLEDYLYRARVFSEMRAGYYRMMNELLGLDEFVAQLRCRRA